MNSKSESYGPMLEESIKHFLASYRSGNNDFSAFESIFFRIMQTMLDPPMEIAWFYSAVTFHTSILSPQPHSPCNKILMLAKDLFQLLISCSSLSKGSKKIALLAPVVYELYSIVCDSSVNELYLRRDVEDLVEKMVGYLSLCCCSDCDMGNESDQLVVCFEDLVRVWTIDRVGDREVCEFGENSRVFFPIFSYEIQRGIDERCGIQSLAGIVLCEVFLLRLCLKFNLGVAKEELLMDLQNLAVQTIKGFQNCYFLDMLLRMLLEPTLPVTGLLGSDDADCLRKILYDAVILVDYSFLSSGRWIRYPDNHLRNLALMWSLVADTAIRFARDMSDHSRVDSYANAFYGSQLSNQLIRWISSQAGTMEKFRPNIYTPKALIRWLLFLQKQGLKVFDHSIATILIKAAISESILDSEFSDYCKDACDPKEVILSSTPGDNNRQEHKVNMDQEMLDPLSNANPAATCTMKNLSEETRKRKEGAIEEGKRRVKFVKYDIHESSIYNDKFGGGGEMKNPVIDEDIEVMVTS